jgi:hypothetical protein
MGAFLASDARDAPDLSYTASGPIILYNITKNY